MHPATATTPFTLLWALEKNEEAPPFRSFAASPRAQVQQPSRAPTPTPDAQHTELNVGSTRAHDDAKPEAATADSASNEAGHDAFTASDFLVTNLRPDLLD